MINKKMEWKRLSIFLLLAFGLTWIPWIIFNKTMGYHEWLESGRYPILFLISSYGPALANVLTRLITKEGWHDSMLHLRLKGNLKYYILALLLPSIYGILSGIYVTLVYGHWDWTEITAQGSWQLILGTMLSVFSSAILLSFNTFGEEFGWRGYMNQKMEPLLGTAGTILIGGIIWGIWHAPLTVCGHNYGTDYSGFPYVGILLMCLDCIISGIFLMYLTKKTGSIFPAAIMHALHNNGGSIIGTLLISGVPETLELNVWEQFGTSFVPECVVGIIFLVLLVRDKRIHR